MATGTLISVREYLSTSYHPDRDYVDGLVIERNVGELDHSQLQTDLSTYLNVRRQQWGIRVFVEQRVQVRPKRFRVPDICIVTGGRPNEQILTSPPLACIEILSKYDRMSDMQERIDDYLGFGVSYVWVIDPRTRKTYEFTSGGMHEVKELRMEKPEISVPLDAVFE